MFNIAKITGGLDPKQLLVFDLQHEGAIHSILLNNKSDTDAPVEFDVAGTVIEIIAKAHTVETSDFKVNVPAGSTVNVSAPREVSVAVSYIEQPIDSSAALTAAQSLVNQAEQYVSACENALPEGALDDQNVTSVTAWSSAKIVAYTDSLQGNIDYGLITAPVEIATDYGLITEGV